MMNKLGIVLTIVLAVYIVFDALVLEPAKNDKLLKKIEALESQIPEKEVELAVYMNYMQLYMNKLWFAGQAENFELANFYLHEIEETAERIIDANVVEDGHNISQLTETMLIPAVEATESIVKEKQATLFGEKYQLLVNTCNACHAASSHGFIKIKVPERPVFDNQDYTK